MKKTKKAIASLAIASLALTTVPFNVLAADVPTRIAGNTAADTAVEISKQTGWSGSAILASSESYGMSDALAAGPLAYSLKAPILLTENSSTLNAATKAELSRLNVSTVYVTSGTAVIPQAVLNEITAMGITVVPLGGYDRSESSVNMAKRMTGVTKVAVANGVADALSVASIAAAANQPILVVDRDNVSNSVTGYLNDNSAITSADVIGGTGIISDATANKFPEATRHFGYTAYDTNNQVIQDFADALDFDIVYAANGETAIDALSGAPLAAMTKSPIVLTDGKTVPAAATYVSGKIGADGQVTALGGTYVIPENNRVGIQEGRVTDSVGPLAVTSIAANTARSFKIVFNKAVTDTEKIEVEVLQSGSASAMAMSAQWNDSKTEVIVERSTKLTDGDYTVTVKEGETVLRTQDIAITEQKIAKIQISKTLGIASSTNTGADQKGYSSYKVLDQYDDDITKSALANNVSFQTGVGQIEGKNGLITITNAASSGLNLLTFSSGITVSANDTSSGIAVTQTLEVTTKIGTLSDLQIKGLTNANGKTEVRAGDTAEIFYLEYVAYDMGGEETTDYTLVKEGLILTEDDGEEDCLTTSSPYVRAKVVQDPADSNKALIEVKAKEKGTEVTVDMPLVITAMTWAGTNSQLNATLRKPVQVNTIKLYAPDESIASGERKRIPFVAYDQEGDAVTKYTDLKPYVTLSNAEWYEDSDGSAYIKNKAQPNTGTTSVPYTITATLTNGSTGYSMITINIQKPATADNLVLDSSKMVTILQQADPSAVTATASPTSILGVASQKIDLGWDEGGLRVRDNYDRYVDMTNTQDGEVNKDGKFLVRVSVSGTPNVLSYEIKDNLGVGKTGDVSKEDLKTTNDLSNCTDILSYKDQLTIKSGIVGSATIKFELGYVVTNAGTNTFNVLDTKSQSFTSLKDDDIKDYMMDQLSNPIYMVNGSTTGTLTGTLTGAISDKLVVTNKEDEFKARPKVYGLTSSKGKVILRGTPVLSVNSSNTDFTSYNKTGFANGVNNTSEIVPATATGLAWDQVRVIANYPTDETTQTASATISVVIMDYKGDVKNVTTPITSTKTRPAAASMLAKVATEVANIYVDDEDIYLTATGTSLADYKELLGPTLTKYHTEASARKVLPSTATNAEIAQLMGQEVKKTVFNKGQALQTYTQAVHIAPVDQYGTKGGDLTRFSKSTNVGGSDTSIGDDVLKVNSDGTFEYVNLAGRAKGTVLKVTGSSSSGLSKTIRIHFN